MAAAINELDASANEVQQNTQSAADKSVSARERASQGLALVEEAKKKVLMNYEIKSLTTRV